MPVVEDYILTFYVVKCKLKKKKSQFPLRDSEKKPSIILQFQYVFNFFLMVE